MSEPKFKVGDEVKIKFSDRLEGPRKKFRGENGWVSAIKRDEFEISFSDGESEWMDSSWLKHINFTFSPEKPNFKVGDMVDFRDSIYVNIEGGYKITNIYGDKIKIEHHSSHWDFNDLKPLEPTAPFTRAEIDALIDAYPDCNCLAFSEKNRNKTYLKDYSNLQFFSDRKPYSHKGRKIGFEWDEDLTDNQIRVCVGYDTDLATWTQGDPLPGKKDTDAEGWVEQSQAVENTQQNTDAKQPQIQTTHTFSAELPSGEVIEMPPPDGEGWEQVEREEFKRGRMTIRGVNLKNVNVRPWDLKEGEPYRELAMYTDGQKSFLHDFNFERMYYGNVLSITTWRREIQPEPPEEEPYVWPCSSNKIHPRNRVLPHMVDKIKQAQWNAIEHEHREPSESNRIGITIWPERSSEVE